jgi:hypothetical protein
MMTINKLIFLMLKAKGFLFPVTLFFLWAGVASANTSTVVSNPEPTALWYQSEWLTGTGIDTGDFVVSPGKIEITLKPGESVTREITLANRISDHRTFAIITEDIAGGDDGESVKLLGEERGPYTLRDYLKVPDTRLILALGERARIPVTITIPPDAEPGGRYGSLLITTVRDDDPGRESDTAGARSPIIARLGILFFVTVAGETIKDGEMVDLTLIEQPWWYEKGPIRLGMAFENRGSVHLNPYGELRLTNMFGEEVGYQELDPWFVLPKALRTREITWDREYLLGRYTATVAVNRGYDDIVDERSVTFWVLPWKLVGGIFIGFFLVFFLVRLFVRTFEFKRRSR